MESGPAEEICRRPRHPYARLLLSAVPGPNPARARAALAARPGGEAPSALAPPSGCVFRTRCPHAEPACTERVPESEPVGDGHIVACHRWREIDP
jgi:peptide/nickel transport system ATP-binding protein